MPRSTRRPASGPVVEPASSTLGPRAWQGVLYRPCQAGAAEVRRLFRFAGAWTPPLETGELAWEAEMDGHLVGGVLVECRGERGFIHGPVVVEVPEPLEAAAQLVAPLVEDALARRMDTLFTRPQGLDRVWVRTGFVPVPEASLPAELRDRPGSGLYAWRRPGTYEIAVPEADGPRRRGRG